MALTYCGKGLVHMAKMSHSKTKMSMSRTADQWNEHLSQAGINFDNACQCDRTCIPAILGKAAVSFNRRQYAEALKQYKYVLQLNPACPPEVRIGLAHCYAQLKQSDKAAQAFRRVLQLAPDNVEALSGLAILEMNSEPEESLSVEDKETYMQDQVARALKLLERAYNSTHNLGDQNAVVLNHLANHFVITNDLDKAYRLASKAFNNTEVKKIRAESCYHIARTYHIKNEYEQVCIMDASRCNGGYDIYTMSCMLLYFCFCFACVVAGTGLTDDDGNKQAHKYYEYASQHSPDYLLPQYGLAQTNVHLNKLSEAMACLDKLLKAYPNSYEVVSFACEDACAVRACVCARLRVGVGVGVGGGGGGMWAALPNSYELGGRFCNAHHTPHTSIHRQKRTHRRTTRTRVPETGVGSRYKENAAQRMCEGE